MRLLLILLLWLPLSAQAQGAATLVADRVSIDADNILIATGNVEVIYDGARLSAARIIYDQRGDTLSIVGPIFIQDSDGVILTADRADIDPRLENGILRGARLVLDQQLQLAANQIDRVAGRYSQLYKTAATSCSICGTGPPLWDIRAERVIHDQDAQQLYFSNAQFRIRGTPVIWVPRMRLPDPTNTRTTGLLLPRIRTTNLLGSGVKLPYFIVLGPSRDLLLSPYISTKTRTLEARYRQAFLNGDITINLAGSDDRLLPDTNRGYVFAEGAFDLGDRYQLAFDIEAASDNAYLLDYAHADKDRLDSAISVTRVDDSSALSASLTNYQTLRDDEINSTLPPITANVAYRRLWTLAGGTLGVTADGVALVRYGTGTGDAGRDVTRLGFGADWSRTHVAASGIVATGTASLRGDYYQVNDAIRFDRDLYRATPSVSLILRYPLVKTTAGGAQLLEPMLALHWSDTIGDTPPNEDSTRPEFDGGNLLSATQFPGQDATDTGFRGAAGLRWTRKGRDGSDSTLTFGRAFRETATTLYSNSTGLGGQYSDWLLSGQFHLAKGFALTGHTLFADDLAPTLAQARINWQTSALDIAAAYIWQEADRDLGRPIDVSEWTVDGTARLSPAWAVNFDARYDIITDRPARAGFGVEYQNECVTVDLSVSRRYTSSDNIDPSTDYGLSVSLAGFSAATDAVRPTARCTP